MSKPDIASMSPFEALLERALDVELPDSAAAMIELRVSRAMAGGSAPLARGFRVTFPGLTLRRATVIALVAMVLMGAAITLTLLEQAAELMPGWRVAYDRADRVGLSQTVGGYTVTLERAYADPNQVVLAFTTAGPKDRPAAVARAEVTNDQGRHYLDFAGGDVPADDAPIAATISAYDVPRGVGGPLRLHVRVDSLLNVSIDTRPGPTGPWEFAITVPLRPAVTVSPNVVAEAAQVPIRLDSVRLSPTAIRVHLTADLTAVRTREWSTWVVEASIRRGNGPDLPLDWSAMPDAWTGQSKEEIAALLDRADGSEIVRQTTSGVDDPTGQWTLVIHRLWGADGMGGTREVSGSWTFHFLVN